MTAIVELTAKHIAMLDDPAQIDRVSAMYVDADFVVNGFKDRKRVLTARCDSREAYNELRASVRPKPASSSTDTYNSSHGHMYSMLRGKRSAYSIG